MPAPKTTHVDPGSTLAVFIAAPSPVESPQAKRHACSGGASGHPRVWLRIDPEKGWVECGYCDKRYVLKPGSAPADH